MSIRAARSIGRHFGIVSSIVLIASLSSAEAGQMYSVAAIGHGKPSGISNSGQVLIDGSIYQNGTTTPVPTAFPSAGAGNLVISPGGTIAYSPVIPFRTSRVIKDGQD